MNLKELPVEQTETGRKSVTASVLCEAVSSVERDCAMLDRQEIASPPERAPAARNDIFADQKLC
jgi:hypothetical protein